MITHTMAPEILKALEESIVKWEEKEKFNYKVVAYNAGILATENCPLCKICLHRCKDCPIAIKVGAKVCNSTPYVQVVAVLRSIRYSTCLEHSPAEKAALTRKWRAACRKEVEFLKSLLPAAPNRNRQG
jgi:hypothetical protein